MMQHAHLPALLLEPLVRAALTEDLAPMGDATSRAVIPAGLRWEAVLNAREVGVVSGMELAALAFRLVDPTLTINLLVADGAACAPGQALMKSA